MYNVLRYKVYWIEYKHIFLQIYITFLNGLVHLPFLELSIIKLELYIIKLELSIIKLELSIIKLEVSIIKFEDIVAAWAKC